MTKKASFDHIERSDEEKKEAIIKALSDVGLTEEKRQELNYRYVVLQLGPSKLDPRHTFSDYNHFLYSASKKDRRLVMTMVREMLFEQILIIKNHPDLNKKDLECLIREICNVATRPNEKRDRPNIEDRLNRILQDVFLTRALVRNQKEIANRIIGSIMTEITLPDQAFNRRLELIIERYDKIRQLKISLSHKRLTQLIAENLTRRNIEFLANNVSDEISDKIIDAYNNLDFFLYLPSKLEKRKRLQYSDLEPSAPPLELSDLEPSAPSKLLMEYQPDQEYSDLKSEELLSLCSKSVENVIRENRRHNIEDAKERNSAEEYNDFSHVSNRRSEDENSIKSHQRGIAEELLNNLANPNYINEDGKTPLGEAARNNNAHIAKILIARGASIFTGLTTQNLAANPLVIFTILERKKTVNSIISSEKRSSEVNGLNFQNLRKLNDLVRYIINSPGDQSWLGRILEKENAIFLSQNLDPEVGIKIAEDFNKFHWSKIEIPEAANEREMYATSATSENLPVAASVVVQAKVDPYASAGEVVHAQAYLVGDQTYYDITEYDANLLPSAPPPPFSPEYIPEASAPPLPFSPDFIPEASAPPLSPEITESDAGIAATAQENGKIEESRKVFSKPKAATKVPSKEESEEPTRFFPKAPTGDIKSSSRSEQIEPNVRTIATNRPTQESREKAIAGFSRPRVAANSSDFDVIEGLNFPRVPSGVARSPVSTKNPAVKKAEVPTPTGL